MTSPLVNNDQAGFTGHIKDSATGLNYMQARYYDPLIGRFLSIDPVGFSPERPEMFGSYTYVNNDPVNLIDPTGLCSTGTRLKGSTNSGCRIAYSSGRKTDQATETRKGVQTHYQDGSDENLTYDAEEYEIGTDDQHDKIAEISASGGGKGIGNTIQSAIEDSLSAKGPVPVTFTTSAEATTGIAGQVIGQHTIDWTGNLTTDAEAKTYSISAIGTVRPDAYNFNFSKSRSTQGKILVAGAHLVPTRMYTTRGIFGIPTIRVQTYAQGKEFNLISNSTLKGEFWGPIK